MSVQPLLEARRIVKSFGRVEALRGADFTVYPGEVVALVGDNGAGKSVLVKTLVGVYSPDSGEILFEGRPVDIRTNLFSAEGAASGVREAGAKDVKIVGFDAGPKQVKDLEDGTVQALIAQKPADIGSQGVQQAFNALEGKPTTKKIGTESTTITKDTLSENQAALYKPSC